MDEFEDYITNRLFTYLETHPDEVLFNWFRTDTPYATYNNYNREALTIYSNVCVTNNEIFDSSLNTEFTIAIILDTFIDVFNNMVEENNLNVLGIYHIILSPAMYNPNTFEPSYKVLFRCCVFPENENQYIKLSEITKIKKPKTFKH